MTDNNTPNTTQQENTTQPEGNGPAGKMFTQEEVNNIVRERLARERAKGTTDPDTTQGEETDKEKAALAAERQQLQKDRQAFECERYCKENGFDTKLVELLGVDEPEAFKAKAEKIQTIFVSNANQRTGNAVHISTGATHGSPMTPAHDGTEYFMPSAK